MPKTDTARARSPRGTKPVILAFFEALDAIPEGQRADVAKAAHAGIRDAIKAQRDKTKLAKTKAREKAAGAQVPKAGKASKGAKRAKATRSTRGAAKPAAARALKAGRRSAAKSVTSGTAKRNAGATPAARRSRTAGENQGGSEQNGDNPEVQTPAAMA